jgi:hypothetical protein
MKNEIVSQLRSSLKMLINTIDECPEQTWTDEATGNAYWRIVYHSLYYTSLYLVQNVSLFTPWEKHLTNYNRLGSTTAGNEPIIIDTVYSRDEMKGYAESILNSCEFFIQDSNMYEPSGYEWLPMDTFEKHLYNIRHLQHHIGQLIERLHTSGIWGIKWEQVS